MSCASTGRRGVGLEQKEVRGSLGCSGSDGFVGGTPISRNNNSAQNTAETRFEPPIGQWTAMAASGWISQILDHVSGQLLLAGCFTKDLREKSWKPEFSWPNATPSPHVILVA
jgi:hypothetical protein